MCAVCPARLFNGSRSKALRYLPGLMTSAGFTALYLVVPNSRVRVLHGLIGALVTTTLFQLAFKGFTVALQYFIYDAISGVFAALLVFLLWLYLVWLLILSGALFVCSLSLHGAALAVEEPLLIKAMRVL
ncbi:MAG TPA: hypothetical protein DHU16_05005 [Gammaproteobacteria bacterium]|nr:hypothetical protein [Gammaproteobacteria bacterium]